MNNQGHKGAKCYTNGIKTILLYEGDVVPEGFYRGRCGNYKETAWRKGLTKENDPRIVATEQKRLQSRVYTPTSDETKQKISKSLLGKNVGKIHSKDQEAKRFATMKRNGTLNTSRTEESFYESLCNQYGKDNVIHHYKDGRYPFNCDFYIKGIDKFIEYNEHWTHGSQPFDSSNKEHLNLVEKWKSKSSKYYDQAIDTWTQRDVKKLETFRKNNLNFEIIYKNGLVVSQ